MGVKWPHEGGFFDSVDRGSLKVRQPVFPASSLPPSISWRPGVIIVDTGNQLPPSHRPEPAPADQWMRLNSA